jgi:acyl-CoA dehydrogenase
MERRLRQAEREGLIHPGALGGQIDEAEHAGVISKKEAAELRNYHGKVSAMLAVDDFSPEELARGQGSPQAAAAATAPHKTTQKAPNKAAPGKKKVRKKAKSKKKVSKS